MVDEAVLPFPADHPAFCGHFPGNPVVPGALLLDAGLAAVCAARDIPYEDLSVDSAKFLDVVRPGQGVTLHWQDAGPDRIDLRFLVGDRLVAVAIVSLMRPARVKAPSVPHGRSRRRV
ncbi:hypothetical protein [Acidiferrobacter sp.]|uniref:hypothetical protein n=1 Tax=Acidiferrobacter sp. TaxID=1872107 RepID=UPI0026186DEB|nr:hypothetical protein [Acidiferrobacter sp.]